METVLNIRAAEMTALREKNRRLRRLLSEMRDIAAENDAMVLSLHRLSLLLIARRPDWQARAESLLRREWRAAECKIVVFARGDAALKTRAARLPAGGRADKHSMLADDSPSSVARRKPKPAADSNSDFAAHYHLPLRVGRQTKGLLALTLREAARGGDDDFCKRLAALLAAAL